MKLLHEKYVSRSKSTMLVLPLVVMIVSVSVGIGINLVARFDDPYRREIFILNGFILVLALWQLANVFYALLRKIEELEKGNPDTN